MYNEKVLSSYIFLCHQLFVVYTHLCSGVQLKHIFKSPLSWVFFTRYYMLFFFFHFTNCLNPFMVSALQKNDGFWSARLLPAQHTVHQHLPQHQVRPSHQQHALPSWRLWTDHAHVLSKWEHPVVMVLPTPDCFMFICYILSKYKYYMLKACWTDFLPVWIKPPRTTTTVSLHFCALFCVTCSSGGPGQRRNSGRGQSRGSQWEDGLDLEFAGGCREEGIQRDLRSQREHTSTQFTSRQRQKYTRAKGKTAPKKYNFAPDITRRGANNTPIISSNNYELTNRLIIAIWWQFLIYCKPK